ncbi:MAG: hypothetical protein ACRDPS_24350 [Nocardioides sp.]|uniref:hypothetical protein n=1 Tax=Nocardioides sp. TaxID=35761 RepID=UPI003D6A9D60
MGHKENQPEAIEAGGLRGDAAPANPDETVLARPRLGAPNDSWATVLKDVVREAPKTALVIVGTVLYTLLSLIANLIGVFAGRGTAAPPSGPPIPHGVQVMLEVAWRTIMNGG